MSRPVIVALDLDNEKKLNELLPKLGKPENVFIKIPLRKFVDFVSRKNQKTNKQKS